MRSRNIKPSFFKNETLASLPFECRLLFQGLWCIADRNGRFEYRPKRIHAEVFPYDHKLDIEAMMAMLEQHAFISIYTHDEKQYVHVINFEKHQSPHMREQASTIPAPDKAQPRQCLAPTKAMPSTSPARLNPESFNLNPESPTPQPGADSAATEPPPEKYGDEIHFRKIWSRYPRKIGLKAAVRHYGGSVKTLQDFLDIQKALDNYLASDGVRRGFVQHGSTWMNNWRDWINYTEVSHGTDGGTSHNSLAADAERAREIRRTQGLRSVSKSSVGKILAGIRDHALATPDVAGVDDRESVRAGRAAIDGSLDQISESGATEGDGAYAGDDP